MFEPVERFAFMLLGGFCLILIIALASDFAEKLAKHQYRSRNRYRDRTQNNDEPFEAALHEAIADSQNRKSKARNYWRNPNNWIRILTLLAVAAYTGVTFWQLTILKATERRQLRGYLGIVDLRFDCGDCLPTEDDEFTAETDNFGQTPVYITSGILWFTEYRIDEPLPETDIHRSPVTEADLINRSGVIYPKHPEGLNFPITDVNRQIFWEAKSVDYWILIRGFVRYRDIFDDRWDHYFCFIYNPTIYRKGIGMVRCLQYAKEEPAPKQRNLSPQPGLIILPDLPDTKL
jgi:hypothetical protein